jgi:ribosomal protein L37AE/L43A
VIKEPIALALVRCPDGLLLALQGLQKLDLPGSHAPPGVRLEVALERRLAVLGIAVSRFIFRWGAVAYWGGDQRPVSVFDARGWTGTPSEDCSWASEEEIACGARALLYRRLFEKLRSGGAPRVEDASSVILEATTTKPQTFCPRCGATMRLRNGRMCDPLRWDCRACACAWTLAGGAFARIEALVGG